MHHTFPHQEFIKNKVATPNYLCYVIYKSVLFYFIGIKLIAVHTTVCAHMYSYRL